MEPPSIDALRRRIRMDPASFAFAQLADEYRRAGRFDEAERTCRAGLARHPMYLSARVTLGRTLIGLGRYDEARAELEAVLREAPDHLSAERARAELPHPRHQADADGPRHPSPERAGAIARLEHWLEALLQERAERNRTHPTLGH